MHKFYFNGHWSDEFGIRIESPVPLTRSARKFQSASVMGRNGNIYQMQDAFDEVIVAYKIFAGEPRKGANVPSFTEIMEWLHGENGYSVLKDTYDLEHYRKAVFVDAVEIENVRTMWGRATLYFRCRPENYIIEDEIEVTSGDVIENETNHVALPLITLTGAGASNLLTMENRTAMSFTYQYEMADLMPLPADSVNKYVVGLAWKNPYVHDNRVTFVSAVDSTGTLTFSYTHNDTGTFGIGYPVKVDAKTKYTISGNYSGSGVANVSVFQYKPSGEYKGGGYKEVDGDFSFTFQTGYDVGYIVLSFTAQKSSANHVFSSLMLNKGDTAQPFRQYSAGSSSITIGETTLTVNVDFSEAIIDCERENVEMDGADSNQNVSLSDPYGNIAENFLRLEKGNNEVTYSGDITACKIESRFWEL